MGTFAWQCPFCAHHATISDQNHTIKRDTFDDGNKYSTQRVVWRAVSCPNPQCREYTLRLSVFDYGPAPGTGVMGDRTLRHSWELVPAADMKVLPNYLPAAVLADYKEACLIAKLSPKASATLARRCLQGMIRDFWGVNPGRLVDEIAAIHDRVDGDTWTAIESVRKIGNIGAHMEGDINVIVDVEPKEAKLLIGLIETLVDEWYVARHDKKSRLAKLAELAKEKLLARKAEPPAGETV